MKQTKESCKNSCTYKGFTLIELLVVVLIIGILASIALPQYKKVLRRSEFARIQSTLNAILDAEERYFLMQGTYTGINNLDIDIPGRYLNEYGTILPNGSICSTNTQDGQFLFCATKDRRNVYLAITRNSNLYSWGRGKKYCGACAVLSSEDINTTDQYNKFCQKLTNKDTPNKQINWMLADKYCRGQLYQFE